MTKRNRARLRNWLMSIPKRILGYILFTTNLHKLLLKERAVIVTFHSISDKALRSGLRCPSEEFREVCVFLKKNFDVVSLEHLNECRKSNRSIAGMAVITFDDGYKDNYDLAAPILMELKLPATFFVVSGFIGSKVQADWDIKAGIESQWMTWRDVKDLADRGFEIGCHTASHIDCGVEQLSAIEKEVEDSRSSIKEKTGRAVMNFAFPFGGEKNTRQIVEQAIEDMGFECAVTCFGGLVNIDDHAFVLPRVPYSDWYFSTYQFGFELFRQESGTKPDRY